MTYKQYRKQQINKHLKQVCKINNNKLASSFLGMEVY